MAKDCCAELTLDDKDQDDERLYLTCTSKHIGPDVIEQRRDETSEGLKWKKIKRMMLFINIQNCTSRTKRILICLNRQNLKVNYYI